MISRQNTTQPTCCPSQLSLTPISCTTDSFHVHAAIIEQKKKKKKKKSNKSPTTDSPPPPPPRKPVPDVERPMLCISRNKHWKYISSYHGPWLQLPLELLESLLDLNLDPTTYSNTRAPSQTLIPSRAIHPPPPQARAPPRLRECERTPLPPDPPRRNTVSPPLSLTTTTPSPLLWPMPSKPTPPHIDPGVFRNIVAIRRLIDEAAELTVRASSGLSQAALGSIRGGNNNAWSTAQSFAFDGAGNVSGGRNVAMSAMRIHRLRAQAVQKLAAAYKADEIASSVMIMQGGSVFDDIAERVLRNDPDDPDAKYVHFFHEKIPSRANRQLADSTTTCVLDELIATNPQRLEFYRTRGIVHCFRDEYTLATKDFTYALKEARSARKGRTAHHTITLPTESSGKCGKKKKACNKTNGQAPLNGTNDSAEAPTVEGPDGESPLVHPSVSPDAPDPIEPQLLFLRGAAYLQHALHLIESTIMKLEGVRKPSAVSEGTELRMCYLANGRYGGVEIGNPDGPLGKAEGPKAHAYRGALGEESFRDDVCGYLRKCIRDHERFLAHFDTLEGQSPVPVGIKPADLARKVEIAFLLSEVVRPGSHSVAGALGFSGPQPGLPLMYTTYHPLLVESHFTILTCQLMLAELPTLLRTFVRTALLVDGLEGYPIFLPPRSVAQAEFVEVLERLASGWRVGIQPHSAMRPVASMTRSRLAIQAPPPPRPPVSPSSSLPAAMSSSSSGTTVNSLATPFTSTSSATSTSSVAVAADATTKSAINPKRTRVDLAEALDSARMLLVPVAARQRERVSLLEKVSSNTGVKKPLNINIPLHGPRVEIILAWLAAVHLVELESVVA